MNIHFRIDRCSTFEFEFEFEFYRLGDKEDVLTLFLYKEKPVHKIVNFKNKKKEKIPFQDFSRFWV